MHHWQALHFADPRELVLLGRVAEDLGYTGIALGDHLVLPDTWDTRYPYSASGRVRMRPQTMFPDPWVTFGALASQTEHLKFATWVYILALRDIFTVAKSIATLDHLAPGRVILGAGVGWMQEEIELLGVPYARRGAWSDEALRVMRACWRDGRASFSGEFFTFDDLGCRPGPANGSIPIWIGGHTERALTRVATLGDGWHAAFPSLDKMRDGIARLREACRRVGRDPAALTVSARVGLSARRVSEDVLAEVRALRDLGVAHVILETGGRDVAQMVTTCERFASEVRGQL